MSKKLKMLVVVLGVLLVVAPACAPPATPAAERTALPGEPTPTPAPPAPSPTTAMEEESLVFTYSVPFEIPNIDPAIVADWPGGVAVRALYDPLLRARGAPVELQPWLAESYEVSEDGTEYTFHIRDDAVFHDGSPVTSDAVAYSYERFMALQAGYSWMFTDVVESVTVVDDQTVRFTLSEPFGPFTSTLGYFYIVNPAVVRAHEEGGDWGSGWLLDHEAGSGPCTISRFEPGVMYEFEADPDYWAGWPHETNPDFFRYMVMREPGAAKLSLDGGETDWLIQAEEEDVVYFEGKEGFKVELRSTLEKVFIYMNTASEGPTGDVNVRQAIAHAFDYAGANQALFDMLPSSSYVPESLPGAVVSEDLQRTDLDLARDYLARSPWPDGGFELEYIWLGGWSPEETAGLILLEGLSELNIRVNMISKTWGEMEAMCNNPETIPEMIFITEPAAYADPYSILFLIFGPSGINYYGNCHRYINDERVGALLAEARTEPDEARRSELYGEVQEILVEARPAILVGDFLWAEVHNDHWQADSFTPLFGYIGYPGDYYYTP